MNRQIVLIGVEIHFINMLRGCLWTPINKHHPEEKGLVHKTMDNYSFYIIVDGLEDEDLDSLLRDFEEDNLCI